MFLFFFCKQKTAYEMRISDWSSDVCSSDLPVPWLRSAEKVLSPARYKTTGVGEIVSAALKKIIQNSTTRTANASVGRWRLKATAVNRLTQYAGYAYRIVCSFGLARKSVV